MKPVKSFLYGNRKELVRAGVIAALFLTAGAALSWKEQQEDTTKDGYLLRGDYGSTAYREVLQADLGEESQQVEFYVEPRKYTSAEEEVYLDEAEKALPALVLQGQDAGHITEDLTLPSALPDLPVTASWITWPNAVIRYDGVIGEDVDPDGEEAWAEATLVCEEESRVIRIAMTVYPRTRSAEESLQREADLMVRAADETEERLYLPETLGGREVSWSRTGGSTGAAVAGLGILIAFVYLYSVRRREDEAEDRKKRQMMIDYPAILNKLILYLGAGMSMRTAFRHIASDYRKARTQGGPVRYGMEAVLRMNREMENGRSEAEAYARLGEETDLPRYRTLGLMLVQNLRKGSDELLAALKEEADNAFEERKKQARILGEEAGTKLLFPMLLMLLVVLVILIVPAFLGIYGAQR